MATASYVPVEQYLRTDYSPDCEDVDGEVTERNVGEKGHGKAQKRLMLYLAQREAELGIFALQERRVRLTDRDTPEADRGVLRTVNPRLRSR